MLDHKNDIDEFEILLNNKREHEKHYIESKGKERKINSTPMTADANCSCFDFIKMVQRIVSLDLKEYNIDFSSDRLDYKADDIQIKLDRPIITYQTISRVPTRELKPMQRYDVVDNQANLIGNVYAQRYECIIQFNIFASVYNLAEEVMSSFEDMMIKYAGYFKRNGVAELLFKEEIADSDYNLYRQVVSVRNIRYKVHIDKMYNNLSPIIDDTIINDVTDDATINHCINKHISSQKIN